MLAAKRVADCIAEATEVVRDEARRCSGAAPDGLQRIEVRSVARKKFSVEPANPSLAMLTGGGMNVEALRHDDELRFERSAQRTKSERNCGVPVAFRIEQVESASTSDVALLSAPPHGLDWIEIGCVGRRSLGLCQPKSRALSNLPTWLKW